ncbi:MAG: hypothetical protein A2X32_13035 [Elusimicrobia bacterium GWC2_64_44]|nr:MAG: hypothetical protein A2X32_13035 [Elusimicrobia bacterium GWC2_64_44]
MNDRKLTGYLLLACGLGLMAASSVMLWRTFYGSMEPPQTFASESTVTLTMASGMAVNLPLPPQVNRFANLSLAFMLMFFLAVVGGKVGNLGAKLINGPAAPPPPRQP